MGREITVLGFVEEMKRLTEVSMLSIFGRYKYDRKRSINSFRDEVNSVANDAIDEIGKRDSVLIVSLYVSKEIIGFRCILHDREIEFSVVGRGLYTVRFVEEGHEIS